MAPPAYRFRNNREELALRSCAAHFQFLQRFIGNTLSFSHLRIAPLTASTTTSTYHVNDVPKGLYRYLLPEQQRIGIP